MTWTITPGTIEVATYPVVQPCRAFKSTKRQALPNLYCRFVRERQSVTRNKCYMLTFRPLGSGPEAEPPGERSTISPCSIRSRDNKLKTRNPVPSTPTPSHKIQHLALKHLHTYTLHLQHKNRQVGSVFLFFVHTDDYKCFFE